MSPVVAKILATLKKVKKTSVGWDACCPAHEDATPSLGVKEGDDRRVLLTCRAGCAVEDVVTALGLKMRDLFPQKPPAPPAHRAGCSRICLSELAAHKGLPMEFLRRTFGLTDEPGGGVAIPYRDVTGAVVVTKKRTALVAKEGSYWGKGKPLMPYGREHLTTMQPGHDLWLVEGESDVWAVAFRLRRALGIPGANNAKVLELLDLARAGRLVVVQEPDFGGQVFVRGVHTRLAVLGWKGEAVVVKLEPFGFKDPSDLYVRAPERFDLVLEAALAAAVPLADAVAALESTANVNETRSPNAGREVTDTVPPPSDDDFPGDLDGTGHAPAVVGGAPAAVVPEVAKAGTLDVVWLVDVQPEQVVWVWGGRIPLGKITVLDGDPGLGKSTMMVDLAARLSTGREWPGNTAAAPATGSLFISNEDGIADTIRPRLDVAGANTGLVAAVRGVFDGAGSLRQLSIPGDAGGLATFIVKHKIQLVVVDPLYSHLDPATNSNSDHDVRTALAPLAIVAEQTKTAIVLIRHLRKTGGAPAMYRGGGSIGIIGIARSGLLLAKDPEDDSARIVASVKSNLGPPPPSLGWRFTGGTPPRLEWTGESQHTADSLVNVQVEDEGERSAMDDACALVSALAAKGPVLVKEAKKEAARAGVSERTLERAKARLGLHSRRLEFAGDYVWERTPPHARHLSTMASMDAESENPSPNHADSRANGHARHARQPHARQPTMASMDDANGADSGGGPEGEECGVFDDELEPVLES